MHVQMGTQKLKGDTSMTQYIDTKIELRIYQSNSTPQHNGIYILLFYSVPEDLQFPGFSGY